MDAVPPKSEKPIRKFVGVWLDESLWNYIQAQAESSRDTQSNVVRSMLMVARCSQGADRVVARIDALESRFERHIAAHQKGVFR